MQYELKNRWATRACALLVCLMPVTSCLAQNGPPKQEDMVLGAAERKQAVDTLIREVGQRYVFPDVARKIELALRERQQHGDYEGITSAKKLARTLSEQLYEISKDKHMGVRYSERALPVPANGGKPTDQDKAEELAGMKARNFGVERVELLPGNIGYLDLRNFAPAKAAGDTIGAAMAMLQYTDALVIDLRRNGGGESSGVALMASYLLDERTHISDYYDRATGTTEQSWSIDHLAGPRYGADRPVYILTSGRTFSAAEEFSYDMKAMKRATIVGETSGGGAHPGDVYRLSEHFQMFIPTGRAINPITKADWDGVGVTPDIGVAQDRALPAAESSVLKNLIATVRNPGRKARLQRRLEEVEAGGADKVSAK